MGDALIVCPESPYPVAGGGPTRTACVLEYLASRYSLDVITFREVGNPDPRSAFPKGLVREVAVLDLPHHSKSRAARSLRNLRRLLKGVPPLVDRFSGFSLPDLREHDVAVIEHFWCAPYIRLLRPRCRRIILDLHNIESVLLRRCADTEGAISALALRRFARVCQKLEDELLPDFDDIIVTSPTDQASVGRGFVVPNALPYRVQPVVPKDEVIAFSGNMAYHPNAAAVQYFASAIWPRLSSRRPELKWRLIGKNAESVRLPDHSGVEVLEKVDDSIAALAAARAAVVPLLSGSGTRIKILEAWAAAIPVVSTSIGAEGLGATDGEHLLLADSPEAFSDAVLRVLDDHLLARRLAVAGRALYEARFTWPAAWKGLAAAGV